MVKQRAGSETLGADAVDRGVRDQRERRALTLEALPQAGNLCPLRTSTARTNGMAFGLLEAGEARPLALYLHGFAEDPRPVPSGMHATPARRWDAAPRAPGE